MTTSAISSQSSLYLTQNIQSISTQSRADRDGDNDGSGSSSASGAGSTVGAFMQNAIQSLQGLGLNVSGVSSTQTSAVTGSSSAVSSNTSRALQTFLHDLYQVLTQGNNTTQQSSSTDSDGDNDNSGGVQAANNVQSAYNNPSANLQNLISSLSNNTGNSSPLQTDFTNLVQSLGGSTSSSGTSLQDFLKQLSANTANGNSFQGGLGSLFSAVA